MSSTAPESGTPETGLSLRGLGARGGASAVARVLVLGLQTLQFAFAARLLDEPTFGALAAALALWTVVGGLAEFGLLNTTILEFGRNEERLAARSSAAASLMLVSVAVMAGLLVGGLLLKGASRWALVELLPWFIVSRLRLVNLARHQFHFRVRRLVTSELVARALLVLLTLPLFAFRTTWTQYEMLAALVGVLFVSEVVAVVGITIGHADSFWPMKQLPWASGRKLIREAAPLGLTNASSLVHSKSDQILLDAFGRQSAVALYAVTYRINDAFLAVANALGTVTFPALTRSDPEVRARLARFLLAMTGAAAALAGCAVFAFAPFLLSVIGGPSYSSGADLARLLAPALVVSVSNLVVAQLAIVEGRTRVLFASSVVFACVNIGLNIALIPWLGAEGAAIATVATETVGFAFVTHVARRSSPHAIRWWAAFLPVVGFWVATFGARAWWRVELYLPAAATGVCGLLVAVVPAALEMLRGIDRTTAWTRLRGRGAGT